MFWVGGCNVDEGPPWSVVSPDHDRLAGLVDLKA